MTELPLLAEQLGTTDRTLRRAVADGLIRAERPSPRTLRLTAGERAYLRRHWPLLARLRARLRTEPSVELAVLFGSFARGSELPDSDVDVLVSLRQDGAAAAARLARRLSEAIGREAQVTRLEQAVRSPLLLAEVTREGRVLVDRGDRWPELRRRAGTIERQAEADLDELRRALAG